MITIHGRAKNKGIAIAVAAVVDPVTGINGVSQSILQQGISALRQRLDPKDYPEVIIASYELTTGLAVKIPGVRTIGVAAQSEVDLPGLDVEVPCVIDLENLLPSITEGDILILDGNKGVVYIDPDPPTLIHYQQIEEHHVTRSKIFISSEHIPAKTQAGEIINVFAYATTEQGITKGLDDGADGLLIDLRETQLDTQSFYEQVYTQAAGKPVWFGVSYLSPELARMAAKHALPDQTTVLLHIENYGSLMEEAEAVMENVEVEAFLNDLDAPKLRFGLIASSEEYSKSGKTDDESPLALALNPETETDSLHKWTDKMPTENVVIIIGNHIDMIPGIVESGGRCVAVDPELVSAAKYTIRSIGAQEE